MDAVRKMIRTVVGFLLTFLLLRRMYRVKLLRMVPTLAMIIAAMPPINRLSRLSIRKLSKNKHGAYLVSCARVLGLSASLLSISDFYDSIPGDLGV